MNKSHNDQALKLVKKWVGKIGPHEARKRLVARDFALTTAYRIIGGIYESTPTDRTAFLLLDEMAKDGISLTDEVSA